MDMAEERGCGERIAGGVYLETRLSPTGHPLECFFMDPPGPVNTGGLGITPRGVSLITGEGGVTHVWDLVGGDSYPNVADIIEEGRRLGFSRRIASTADFSRLTRSSRLILLHPRAIIFTDHQRYLDAEQTIDGLLRSCCPQVVAGEHCGRRLGPAHPTAPDRLCGRYWYHDITGGVEPDAADSESGRAVEGEVQRTVGRTRYFAYPRPEGCVPEYRVGIIGAFPISGLAVVADPLEGKHEEGYAAAKHSSLPVTIERD
jgi:hypothetical protein